MCISNTVCVNCNEDYDVYIGRPSKWGNPFTHIKNPNNKNLIVVATRKDAIARYREWITTGDGVYLLDDLHELAGKRLGCWCKPKNCHGDVLVELINNLFKPKPTPIW